MNLKPSLSLMMASALFLQSVPVRAAETLPTGPASIEVPSTKPGKSGYTPQQQDRILAEDLLRQQDQRVYDFSSTAYAVWAANQNYDQDPSTHVFTYAPEVIPGSIGGGYTRPYDVAMTREEFLANAAADQQSKIEGLKVRGTFGETLVKAAVGVAGAVAVGLRPQLLPTAPIILPVVGDGVIRAIEIDPDAPELGREVTLRMWDWAMEEIRLGSPEGRELEKLLGKYKIQDPRDDRSDTPAVREANELQRSLLTREDVQRLVQDNKDLKRLFIETQKTLQAQSQKNKTQPPKSGIIETPTNAELEKFFGEAAQSLGSLSTLLAMSGHAEEAEFLGRMSKLSKGMELVTKAQEMAGLAAANVYLYAAVMVYEAIGIAGKPSSPYPAIFEMLKQISRQIDELRIDIGNRLNIFDAKLSAMMTKAIHLSDAAMYNTQQIQLAVAALQQQLEASHWIARNQMSALFDVLIGEQDRDCTFMTGTGELLKLDRYQYIKCRNFFVERGTTYARYSFEPAKGEPMGSSVIFPAGDQYEYLRKLLDPKSEEYRRPLAHPDLWSQSVLLMSQMVATNPEFRVDLRQGTDLVVHPLVQAGTDLHEFTSSLLFDGTGPSRRFRTERLSLFVEKAKELQQAALNKIQETSPHDGTAIDVVKGLKQEANPEFDYQMLAQTIPFCPDVKPRLLSVHDFVLGISGGGSGIPVLLSNLKTAIPNGTTKVRNVVFPVYRYVPQDPEPYRQMLKDSFAKLTADKLPWDRSIIKAIAKEISLFEQSGHRNAKTSACISKLELEDLNQSQSRAYSFKINLGIQIATQMDIAGQRSSPIVVQNLFATANLSAKGKQVLYVETPRINAAFAKNWPSFQAALIPLLTDTSTPEMNQNRERIAQDLEQFIRVRRQALLDVMSPELQTLNGEYAQTLANMQNVISIGIGNPGQHTAAWRQTVNDVLATSYPSSLAASYVHGGGQIEDLQNSLRVGQGSLQSSLQQMSTDRALSPPANFDYTLGQLRQMYWLDAVAVKAEANKH